jgi:transmembrane sensor
MNMPGEEFNRWEEALSWYTTLQEGHQEDLTSAIGTEWRNWYADNENRRIFDDVSRLLAGRSHYRKRSRPGRAGLEVDQYDLSISIAAWRNSQAQRENLKRRPPYAGISWRWLSSGFAIAALGALSAFVIFGPLGFFVSSAAHGTAIYQTDTGGLKDIRLPDGSTIILGGRTKVSVAFTQIRRSVTLIDGQAWFKVGHNPRWPFVVSAGNGTITDVGTAFLVTRDSNRLLVTVTEGTVEVALRPDMRASPKHSSAPVLSPIRVDRGEELALGYNGALSLVKHADIHAATAWTQGQLIFDDQPLRHVVETVNRYSSRRIAVTPSAGALRFSGIVHPGEIEPWLQGLKKIFPVSIDEHGLVACVRMSESSSPADGSCANRP